MGGLSLRSGRVPTRATLATRGVVFLALIAVVVALLGLVGRGAFADRMEASAVIDDVGGSLVPGADVKYDGVVIGKVVGLRRTDPGAGATSAVTVDLSLESALVRDVPANVHGRVLPASVFGTSFLDLVPPLTRAGSLQTDQVIAQDTSGETLEIQQVLDGLDEVVKALGPAELQTTLAGLAQALDGRGEQLGQTIERLDAYLRKLNPSIPLLRTNLDLLATNLEAFERYAPDLFDATDDALVAARTLALQEGDFRGLVRDGSATLGATDRVLTDNRQALVASLVRTAVVVDALYDRRDDLVAGVLGAIDWLSAFRDALSYGPWLRIDADVVLDAPEGYDRSDCPSFGGVTGRGC